MVKSKFAIISYILHPVTFSDPCPYLEMVVVSSVHRVVAWSEQVETSERHINYVINNALYSE
jgi:hypothetical protein